MNSSVINKLYGRELFSIMEDMVQTFKELNYDEETIYKNLRGINESVRVGIYLIALKKNYDVAAYRINKVNKRINEERAKGFIASYKLKETDKFLSTLGKSDKISLMSDLGVDVSLEERIDLPDELRDYYTIISNSIMDAQEGDLRNGLDQFINYKKET
jgi:hypothetical protein